MITNRQYRLSRSSIGPLADLPARLEQILGVELLRWSIMAVSAGEVEIEATVIAGRQWRRRWRCPRSSSPGPAVVVSVIPTGVGCDIGGYAGDSGPVTSLLAATCDVLVTNPNAVNASDFIHLPDNVAYTEGYGLDLFCRGATCLYRPHANAIGLIVERASTQAIDAVLNVANAVRATHGVNIERAVITEERIGSRCLRSPSGAFTGTIDRPGVLLAACHRLVKDGVDAIAVVTDIQDLPADLHASHFAGLAPNPMGGVEAVISHLITRRFGLPAAHAPMVNRPPVGLVDPVVDARGAAEISSGTGLGCILIGLRAAPRLEPGRSTRIFQTLRPDDILAVVAPSTCMGGVPVLSTRNRKIPAIAVRQNRTILDVTQSRLRLAHVIEVENYAEAAGVILAIRRGLSLESIRRPLRALRTREDIPERGVPPRLAEAEWGNADDGRLTPSG